MTTEAVTYPIRVEADPPERLSRLLIFVKWLLAIPHFIALAVVGFIAYFAIIGAFFAVLFTGNYPPGLYNFVAGTLRWGVRVSAYILLITDAYPPFSLDDDPSYPVRVHFDPPGRIANWRPLVQWLLAIPVLIALYAIILIAYIASFFAWFAILFTGRMPQGLFDAIRIALGWQVRVMAYLYFMTDQYPPLAWA